MPTFRHGKTTRVFYGGYDLSSMLRSAGMPRQADTAECTAFTSTNKSYVAGIIGANATFEGMFCHNNTALDELGDVLETYVLDAETPIPVAIGYDSGVTAGKLIKAGLAHKQNVTISGSVSDIVGMNVDMQLTDTAGNGLVIVGPDTLYDFSVTPDTVRDTNPMLPTGVTTWAGGGLFALHVIDGDAIVNGTVLDVQDSADGSTGWVTLFSWTLTAALHQYYATMRTTTVRRYVRFHFATPGTSEGFMLGYFVPKMPTVVP